MNVVRFHYADVNPITLPNKRKVQEYIVGIFQKEKMNLKQLNYIFCSDAYILQINNDFLQHDFYTDIITFDLSESGAIIGELYIGVETVKSNSNLHRVPFHEEMLRVLFHGALHLCGYGDKKKSEITIMRQKEEYYLQRYYKTA